MKKRAYVLIFFLWAFLTIITPTLVQWSAASSQFNKALIGETDDRAEIQARRVIELFQEFHWPRKAPPTPPPPPSPPALPPAPAPEDNAAKQGGRSEETVTSKEAFSEKLYVSRRLLQHRNAE